MTDRADLIADLAGPRWLERAAAEFQRLRQWRWTPVARNSRSAERTRRWRMRRAAGRIVVTVDLPETVTEMLAQSGFLAPLSEDDPKAIRAALEEMLVRAVAREIV